MPAFRATAIEREPCDASAMVSGSTMTPADTEMTQPLELPVDAQPARRPEAVVFEGRYGRVTKLDPARHADDLWGAFRHQDALWTYMSYGPFAAAVSFSRWLDDRASLADPFSFVVETCSGRPGGIVTLMEIRPAMRVVE